MDIASAIFGGILIAFFVALIVGNIAYCCGVLDTQRDAVKNGAGLWWADKNGNTQFRWRKELSQCNLPPMLDQAEDKRSNFDDNFNID